MRRAAKGEETVDNIATHYNPVWPSNSVVRADLSHYGLPGRYEQFWARKVSETVYEVSCIPFFTRGLSLGDHVHCDDEFTVVSVTMKGGHKTLLVVVANRQKDESRLHESLHAWADASGLLYEF